MGTEGDAFRVIAGRYRLEARLGRGGMGVVWRAADQLLGRRVAVKELTQDGSLPDDDARQQRDRTLREARAVAQLHHPHIIVVHDVVEHDERSCIVMELIDGRSLADRIAERGPVGAAEAARIGIALLGALRTAHEAGVLHRDIKPANVLIESGTDRVVLTDFGIAQVEGATTLTETGSFVGSPEYTAPERMSGTRTGPESDLWSLGALLCAALSGESPFRRDSLGGILHAVVAAEIRPPVQAEPLLPVVRGLLERDPDRRLGAAEAERMLRAFLDTGRTPQPAGVSRPAAPYTPTQRDVPRPVPAARRSSRPSRRAVLVTVLLVAATAGAGISAAALLINRDGDGGGAPTSPAPGTSASRAPGTSTSPAPGGPASTVPSPTASTAPASGTRPAPSGYRTARDPAGFSLAVPAGFTREPQGERVFYLSPGETFRLGIKVTAPGPGGPLGVMRRAAAEGPRTNPGYRDGRVTEATHRGRPAALWEFSWSGFSAVEGPRHTYDLCWEEDGRLYDVWVSAPVGMAREAREHFDVALGTFLRH
ncbi:serine/threonine-protein kinase [Streptomyces shenzhenensis]|uniref:non-specific serine/threonine protein kinase n=1 Tax=Streptomyces shenzhenensis TaxID=943815 RepID=A0A3M0IIC8_9ACTN|nr:serine/threonine-protein kinase [Streptomyces shenzhenensis]RMB87880.1 serine/threonine protein kinase [Streptomyces shenzhenensis]